MREFKVTPKQGEFISADADEVLFGGAAGGGKSYGQLIDALQFAARYKGSRQLILRRTFPELNRSLLHTSMLIFPREMGSYQKAEHLWRFKNQSTIELGFCGNEGDVVKYQSAEYDVIRFDELTHFTEFQYSYLISRNRGANAFPKQVKSTTNPGGIGHHWVKKRFIDPSPPSTIFTDEVGRKRIFIPAIVQDNRFLMEQDKGYLKRLSILPERERKALLEGCWDLFDGQYFYNFSRSLHVVPFSPPTEEEALYMGFDYGLDMFACLFGAVNNRGRIRIFGEIYEKGLLASQAAEKILAVMKRYPFRGVFAPPDLWGRNGATGRSIADIFREKGVPLIKVSAARISGWMEIKEALESDQWGEPRLLFCECCSNLIRTLPALVRETNYPDDIAGYPHELTHAPDALRYLLNGLPRHPLREEPSWQEHLF